MTTTASMPTVVAPMWWISEVAQRTSAPQKTTATIFSTTDMAPIFVSSSVAICFASGISSISGGKSL